MALEQQITDEKVFIDDTMDTEVMVNGILYRLTSDNGHTIKIMDRDDKEISQFDYTPGGIMMRGGYRKRRGRRATRRRSTRRRSTRRRTTRRNK